TGQSELAQEDRLLELRGIDDGQAGRTSGDVCGLTLRVKVRAGEDNCLSLAVQRQTGDDSSRRRVVTEGIKPRRNFCPIANTVPRGADARGICPNDIFGNVTQTVAITVWAAVQENGDRSEIGNRSRLACFPTADSIRFRNRVVEEHL